MKKLLCCFLAICLIFPIAVSVAAEGGRQTARPSVNGRLHVEGTQLVDSSGRAVQLKGVSTHGLTWFPDFINENLFRQVSEDWDGNLVRLAMYASVYTGKDREKSYELMRKGIEAAKAADLYAVVDWHILEQGDPNAQLADAEEFFERITSDYPDCPNLLFEICNEPNGEADWGDVMRYANRVIPLIRRNVPEAVILVGTPEWDRNLASALLRPLEYENLMVKNLIYMLSPLLYAAFAVPVFLCNWLELLVFWLPMFILQDLTLRVISKNTISTKWSGIHETSVMPHLLIPILKESLGFTLSAFKVTDKSAKSRQRTRDIRSMVPFLILIAISLAGIIRIIVIFEVMQTISLLILLFWIIRNLYFLIMALFLVDGRDSDGETVKVHDAEPVRVTSQQAEYEGVTTLMTEHNMTLFLDESQSLGLGTSVELSLKSGDQPVRLRGVVTSIQVSRLGGSRTHTVEILDFYTSRLEYWQLLYDRIPTLPLSLRKDIGVLPHLWQNIAHRVARTTK